MNKYDIVTSWYRNWSQRHPVLDEWIGFGLACLLIWFVAYLVLV